MAFKNTPHIRSQRIIAWLRENPIINRSELCRLAKYNRTALQNAFAGKQRIPFRHLDAFETILRAYGYKP